MTTNQGHEIIELGNGYRLVLVDSAVRQRVTLTYLGQNLIDLSGMTPDRARHFAAALQPQVAESARNVALGIAMHAELEADKYFEPGSRKSTGFMAEVTRFAEKQITAHTAKLEGELEAVQTMRAQENEACSKALAQRLEKLAAAEARVKELEAELERRKPKRHHSSDGNAYQHEGPEQDTYFAGKAALQGKDG